MTTISDQLHRLMAQPQVGALIENIRPDHVLNEAITIQQIPSPTFHEIGRANYVLSRFGGGPLQNVAADSLYNVYGRYPGKDPTRPGLIISAHMDTVFAQDVDLAVRWEDDRVFGPGLGDNSLGVAAMLSLADAMAQAGIVPPCDVWFVADTREEGLGDLAGMRAALTRLNGRLGAAIVLEGMGLGRICHGGIAVRRYKITCTGPGGHSWMHFGRVSAIHELMRLGVSLTTLQPPETPRSTFNIGLIEGGTSVNTIAAEASFFLDLRSEQPESLNTLERQVFAMVDQARAAGVECAIEQVGDRLAGQLPLDHWLVQTAGAVLEMVEMEPSYTTASTDANAVLAAGLPGVTLGISNGGNAHHPMEYVEVPPIAQGMRQVALVTMLTLDFLAVA